MGFECRRSPRIVMALVGGCAIVSLCLFQYHTWNSWASREQSMPEQFYARYRPLDELVPKTEAVRFVLDSAHVDAEIVFPGARSHLAQYALAPRRVGADVESRWVVVDSDRPDIIPQIAVQRRWTLVADYRNGVRLYRTDAAR